MLSNEIDIDGRTVTGTYHRCVYCRKEWVDQFDATATDDCGTCEK